MTCATSVGRDTVSSSSAGHLNGGGEHSSLN